MRGFIKYIFLVTALCFPLVSILWAQGPGKSTKSLLREYDKDNKPLSKTVTSDQTAAEEYGKAVEVIKAGNESLKKGNEDTAYCAFEEATFRLNNIQTEYPEWEKKKVAQQIANIKKVKGDFVAAYCKNLEQMKEGQFRFLIRQRMAIMNGKLDKLIERLQYLEKKYWEQNEDYIKDIRDHVLDLSK